MKENGLSEKALLQGLGGKGISLSVRSLAKFTAENGILCTIKCGRVRGSISLPPKLLGLRPEKWAEDSKEFFTGHVNMGQLSLIPKELSTRLNQLDTRARRLLTTYSINGSYVPLSVYDELKEEFEKTRDEYMKTIDEVVDVWPQIQDEFINGIRKMVNTMGKRAVLEKDREMFIKNIISSIPSATRYRNSAYMELEVRAFPTTGVTAEGLAPDLKDSLNQVWRDDVVSNAVKSIETSIGQVFAQACRTAEIYAKTGKMDSRNLNSLMRTSVRVRKLNLFANPMLESLASRLSDISRLSDEQVEMKVEEAILDSVEYAKSTGIILDMTVCPFTEKQLEDMLSFRHTYAAPKEV